MISDWYLIYFLRSVKMNKKKNICMNECFYYTNYKINVNEFNGNTDGVKCTS